MRFDENDERDYMRKVYILSRFSEESSYNSLFEEEAENARISFRYTRFFMSIRGFHTVGFIREDTYNISLVQ